MVNISWTCVYTVLKLTAKYLGSNPIYSHSKVNV